MAKLFVVSDIHSYYAQFRDALDKAGFDENNEDHWLIVCGDYFDRGDQPLEVMMYLKSLPRKVLIRGNHEDLLEQCCYRGDFGIHDLSNGTYHTICELGNMGYGYTFDECCVNTLRSTRVFRNSLVDYFETKNYIFVHSWIPLKCNDNLPMHYTKNRKFKFNPDWRDASLEEWQQARWGNPFDNARKGLNKTGKTIVFGHWHCSTGWAKAEGLNEFGEGAIWEPYRNDKQGIIGIDRCTAHTGEVNVLVLEDEFLGGDNNG